MCWRVMGQVVRLCLELGLHRRDVIDQIKDEEERRLAVNTFWSVYVLDRRWAFSAGLPYVLPDEEIDPDLPSPVSGPVNLKMCECLSSLYYTEAPAMFTSFSNVHGVRNSILFW